MRSLSCPFFERRRRTPSHLKGSMHPRHSLPLPLPASAQQTKSPELANLQGKAGQGRDSVLDMMEAEYLLQGVDMSRQGTAIQPWCDLDGRLLVSFARCCCTHLPISADDGYIALHRSQCRDEMRGAHGRVGKSVAVLLAVWPWYLGSPAAQQRLAAIYLPWCYRQGYT